MTIYPTQLTIRNDLVHDNQRYTVMITEPPVILLAPGLFRYPPCWFLFARGIALKFDPAILSIHF